MTLWCFPKDFRICAHRSAGRVPKGARRCPRSGMQSGVPLVAHAVLDTFASSCVQDAGRMP